MNADGPHPLIQLARDAILHGIREKEFTVPPDLDSKFPQPSGVFVTLKKAGKLRGCIGSLTPKWNTLAREVAHNARLSALKDPRFPAVTEEELTAITIQVEVLTPPEPVTDLAEMNPEIDGIIVKSGKKQGVLLPAIEGVDRVDQQIAICRDKGEIGKNDPVEYFRFRVQHIA